MAEEEAATLDGQFFEFSKLMDNKRSGTTITLYRSDFWMRQAKLMDDRKLTMTDTGILFNKYSKTELDFDEWLQFLSDLCDLKDLDLAKIQDQLTNCGLPGQTPVVVPQYRDYFLTYKPKDKTMIALNMCWMPGTLKSGLPCEYKSLRMQRLVQLRSNFTSDTAYCESFYDGFLCWGPTPAGHTSYQNCPTARLSDPTQLAFRMCSQNAMWLGRRPDIPSVTGWTNYTPCFPHDVKMLFDKVSEDENAQMKFAIARNTRLLEMVGFSVSLVALLISLFIFTYFRSLRNIRTRIHKNLFSGIVLQVVVRLILYLDQEFVRRQDDQFNEHGLIFGIENMPYICEATYVLLEFSISVMYMWMLIEGLYLSSLVSSNSLKEHVSYLLYLYLGWGIPFMLTAVWAAVAGFHYGAEDVKTCWYGYNFEKTFWIMQAPRWTVIIVEIQSTFSALRATALTSMRRTWRPFPAEVNSIFLMSILRVLIMKMYKSEANEIARIRKAVRAMCFLLPLLGITNGLDMYEPSLSGSVFQFACWSYVSHFLRSFQGFFIALFYCFLNGEVQSVLKKYFSNQRAIRETRRRQSALFRGNGAHTPPSRNRVTFGTLGRNRLFTNTDTNTARIPGRASPHAVVSHTVAIIENERPLQMHQFPCRLADARVMRPDHDSYEADTSI